MASLNLIPSGWDSSQSSYSTISSSYPITNAYTDSSSTTYAYITCKTGSNASTYVTLKFDASAIPDDVTIDSVSCVAKARISSTTYLTSANMQLYYGSTAKGSYTSFRSTSATERSITAGEWTRDELTDARIRFTCGRGTSNTSRAAYLYVYGVTLTVQYTENGQTYTVTINSSGTGVTTPSGTVEAREGRTQTIALVPDTGSVVKTLLKDGVDVSGAIETVTPTGDVLWSVSTNYGTYSTYALSNINDGSTSSYWWSSEAQATGKYVLVTFDEPVTLQSFSTYSSNGTDYPQSCNVLQVSENGNDWVTVGTFQNSQISTFNSLNYENVKYVRIYATSNSSGGNWLVINEITMSYQTNSEPYYAYSFVVESDTVITVVYGVDAVGTGLFVKTGSSWIEVTGIYRKVNGVWTSMTSESLKANLESSGAKLLKKV